MDAGIKGWDLSAKSDDATAPNGLMALATIVQNEENNCITEKRKKQYRKYISEGINAARRRFSEQRMAMVGKGGTQEEYSVHEIYSELGFKPEKKGGGHKKGEFYRSIIMKTSITGKIKRAADPAVDLAPEVERRASGRGRGARPLTAPVKRGPVRPWPLAGMTAWLYVHFPADARASAQASASEILIRESVPSVRPHR